MPFYVVQSDLAKPQVCTLAGSPGRQGRGHTTNVYQVPMGILWKIRGPL